MMWNQVCCRSLVTRLAQSKDKFNGHENISNTNKNEWRNDCLLQTPKETSVLQSLKGACQLPPLYRPRVHSNYFDGCLLSNHSIAANSKKWLDSNRMSLQSDDFLLGESHPQEQSCYASESHLLTPGELDALIIEHDSSNSDHTNRPSATDTSSFDSNSDYNSSSIDGNECSCELCVNRETAVRSSVLRAKQFVDKTVSASNVCWSFTFVHFSIYLINLFLISACLRGLL